MTYHLDLQKHTEYMSLALEQARLAQAQTEVPVGAVIVDDCTGEIIATSYNLRETQQLATAHAELLAIEQACRKLGRWRLSGCTLYVTLEPCFMCAGAIILARIPRVIYGATDPKAGATESLAQILNHPQLNHQCEVMGGILAAESSILLKSFFRVKRKA
jgi:tRNA(adenine34) deaminase